MVDNYLKMATITKANMRMIGFMEKASMFGRIRLSTLDSLRTDLCREWDSGKQSMETVTQDNTSKIRSTAKVYTIGKMERHTKADFSMECLYQLNSSQRKILFLWNMRFPMMAMMAGLMK